MANTTTRYSKSAGTSYPYDLNYKPADIPADVIEVPLADWQAALARPSGATLDVVAGKLVIVPAPAPTLSDAKAAKIDALSAACQAQIYAGFSSSALGAVYSYPFQDIDQTNLNGSITRSLYAGLPTNWTTPFWCATAAGAWDMRPHTAAQIQKVGDDAIAAKLTAVTKNKNLAAQVSAATTIAAVQGIVW